MFKILCQNLKYFVFLFILFLSSCNIDINNPTNSCISGSKILKTEYRSPVSFNSISFASSGNLSITQGDTFSVQVESDENLLQYIITSVNGSTLEIKNSITICPTKINIHVVLPQLKKISLTGSGNISTTESFNFTDFEIVLSGSGNFNLSGKGHSGLLKLDGSGNINTEGIETTVSTAILNGSGNIRVYAKERLTAVINGTGNIYYKGNPYEKYFTINGSGQIINEP